MFVASGRAFRTLGGGRVVDELSNRDLFAVMATLLGIAAPPANNGSALTSDVLFAPAAALRLRDAAPAPHAVPLPARCDAPAPVAPRLVFDLRAVAAYRGVLAADVLRRASHVHIVGTVYADALTSDDESVVVWHAVRALPVGAALTGRVDASAISFDVDEPQAPPMTQTDVAYCSASLAADVVAAKHWVGWRSLFARDLTARLHPNNVYASINFKSLHAIPWHSTNVAPIATPSLHRWN